MSPLSIASGLFSLLSSIGNGGSSSASTQSAASSIANGDFSTMLSSRVASLQAQSIGALTSTGQVSALDFLGGKNGPYSGLSSLGRNLSLFDPESGYRMMTEINGRDASYKAQYSEMSEMQTALAGMQQVGLQLAGVANSGDPASLKVELESFVKKYNDWVGRFEDATKSGGVLAGAQAAQVSLYELRQSVESRFNGATAGVQGLGGLGVTIDPVTHVASFDGAKFDATVGSNPVGVSKTLSEFGSNFARSAELLVSANNFVPNRLSNLDRAIHYIDEHRTSLQTEFGLGDVPRLSRQAAQALAAYERNVSRS